MLQPTSKNKEDAARITCGGGVITTEMLNQHNPLNIAG